MLHVLWRWNGGKALSLWVQKWLKTKVTEVIVLCVTSLGVWVLQRGKVEVWWRQNKCELCCTGCITWERSQIPHCFWSSQSCCVEILGHANRNTKDSSPSLTECVINDKLYLSWHLCLVIHERWRLKYEVNPNTEHLWWMVGFLLLLLIVL